MQTIYLDISNRGVVPTVYAKQGDVGRKFLVVLSAAGVNYTSPTGSVFSVWYNGDSGEGNYTEIGDKSAFVVSKNTVQVEMISQMLTAPGNGDLCLVLNSPDGNQIASWNIPYIVESVPGADSEAAKSYYTAFSKAVDNLPYPDSSLSVAGKAADAKATGDALKKKAPAGFGLGESTAGPAEGDWNNATETGWYSAAANGPTTYACHGTSIKYNDSHIYQSAVSYGNAEGSGADVAQRIKNTNGWQPWEWFNPPMIAGIEYRTAKRHNGATVYTMLVDFGSLTSGEVELPISGTIVSFFGVATYRNYRDTFPIFSSAGALMATAYTLGNKIVVKAQNNQSLEEYTAQFIVVYTK